jgi:hypothetical protein
VSLGQVTLQRGFLWRWIRLSKIATDVNDSFRKYWHSRNESQYVLVGRLRRDHTEEEDGKADLWACTCDDAISVLFRGIKWDKQSMAPAGQPDFEGYLKVERTFETRIKEVFPNDEFGVRRNSMV